MTYDELLETINSYTIREDAPITGFIARAETALRPIVRHYLSEATSDLTPDPTIDVYPLPDDFIEMRQITGTFKRYKPINPTAAMIAEDEIGYYRSGNALVFVGDLTGETVTLLYSSSFPSLTATQTNWLFERFPGVYLAAVLKEHYRWEKDAEGVAIEDAALKEQLAIVAEDDRRGRLTGSIVMEGRGSW